MYGPPRIAFQNDAPSKKGTPLGTELLQGASTIDFQICKLLVLICLRFFWIQITQETNGVVAGSIPGGSRFFTLHEISLSSSRKNPCSVFS